MYSTRPPVKRTGAIVLVAAALLIALAAKLPPAASQARAQDQDPPPQAQPEVPAPAQPQPEAQPQQEQPADPLATDDAPQQQPGQPPTTQPSAGADGQADQRAEDADRAVEQAQAKVDPSYLEPILAERLGEFAQGRLREKAVTAAMWRQSAALLGAAGRLSPRDPRFPRLLIEARLKMQDLDGAIKALADYRRVDPYDRVAQIQLIDLYVDRMQTADARLDYLKDLLERTTLPNEVRAHVATLCVPLLMERSRDEAMAMLDEALRLNPVSPEALRLRYDMVGPEATPAQRCAVLLSLLRSNPTQPEVVGELADLLASVGMAKDAVEWYSIGLRLYPRLGRVYPEGYVSSVGSQLLFTGQIEALDTLLASYLKARPEDADAWFMRLAKERAAGEKGNVAAIEEARGALSARWKTVAARIAGIDPQALTPAGGAAATAPAPATAGPFGVSRPGGSDIGLPAPAAGAAASPQVAPPADPAEAVRRLKSGEGEDWQDAFVNVASDLAWLELYFAEKPDAAAPWVAALKDLLTTDSVTVTRLDGWLDLLQNRPEQASEKLATIADRDPLASLGLIRLAGKDASAQAHADEMAARLQAQYPTGLVSAMVWSALKAQGRDPKLVERPGAADVRAELAKFPKDWMEILNQPTAYYKITAEVLKVAHRYGEPMFGRVTISNITDYELTIGADGVLHPDLWFDARLGGLANQDFPGVAYDRIARITVLPAKTGITQMVRLDQGDLGQSLMANPSVSTQVLASVLINPVATANGVGPGPAGHRQPFNRALARGGFPLTQTAVRKRAIAAVESGTPGEKVRNLDLLAAYVRLLDGQQNLDPQTRTVINEFKDVMTRSREDKTPAVAAWATFLAARLAAPDQRGPFVERLAGDENWPARLLALFVAEGTDPAQQAALAQRLAQGDAEPVVKEYAEATLAYLQNPPPTTGPTSAPAAAPAPPQSGIGAGEGTPIPSGLSVPSTGNNAKAGG